MKCKKFKLPVLLTLFAAAIVALDQWTKWLTVRHVALGEDSAEILGIIRITHTQNTGGAWGMLAGQMWLFVLVMVVFFSVFGFMVYKKWLNKTPELVCLTAIAGGGIGNMIDRLTNGYVTDMIEFAFFDFPVFNVADCFITVGAIALAVYVVFFDREKKPENP